MNLPNKLTIIRVLMIPVFVALYYMTFIPYNYIYAAAVFALAAFTDFLDGYIARKNNLVTNLGKFLDPIADKVLVSTALIVLAANAQAMVEYFGAIAVSIIIARELIVSGFRMVAASSGLVLAADKIGKIKTFFQDISVMVLLLSLDLFTDTLAMYITGNALLAIAVVLTIYSGVSYIVKNRGVLKENK